MSFDPEGFAPSNDRGRGNRRGNDSYDAPDEYDYDDGGSNKGESRFRTVPLVLTVIFGLVAVLSLVLTFNITGAALTDAQKETNGYIMLAGFVSFAITIITGRKVLRRRN